MTVRIALFLVLASATVAAADPAASKQVVTKIADGSIADLIDPKLGLWMIDGADRKQSCGAAMLDVTIAKMVEDDEVNLSCANAASTSECVLGQIGEWGDVVHLYFRQTDRGLVLDGYGLFDENGVVGPALQQHEIDMQQALTHAWVTPCTK